MQVYDEFHKIIIKEFMVPKFDGFDSGRDMCKDGLYGLDNWDSHIKPIWEKYCSVSRWMTTFSLQGLYSDKKSGSEKMMMEVII